MFMLFEGFTPMFAGMTGLALTAVLILGASITASIGPMAFRFLFWIALGIATSAFLKWGIVSVILVVFSLVTVNFFVRGGHDTLVVMRRA